MSASKEDPETKTALLCREIIYGDGHPMETAAINLRAMSTKTAALHASVTGGSLTAQALTSQPVPTGAKVYNPYFRPGVEIQVEWTLSFPMEYRPSKVLDWTGTLAGRQVKRVTLSPYTVTMDSNDKGGLNSAELYALLKDGSTVAAEPSTGSYANLGALEGSAERWEAYNSWVFENPVDVEQVVALTPLGGEDPSSLIGRRLESILRACRKRGCHVFDTLLFKKGIENRNQPVYNLFINSRPLV